MTSIGPEVTDMRQTEHGGPFKLITISALVALVTNGVQWWHGSAETRKLQEETQNLRTERDKTSAEVATIQRKLAESASESTQAWLDQLSKVQQPEDKIMVLSAAFSTSPYENVKDWAKQQMLRLEAQIAERQAEAEQRLAVATRDARAPTVAGAADVPRPKTSNAGAGIADGGAASPTSRGAAVQLAANELERVRNAQKLLAAAKQPRVNPGTATPR